MSYVTFSEPWWQYDGAADAADIDQLYHWFNLVEGVAWLVFAILVLVRYFRFRNSILEIWYATAFLTFAVSDFYEAWEQSAWLVGLKLGNLIVLFRLRRRVMSTYYPEASVY